MSHKTSCVQHPAKARLVVLRDDYLQICDGNHCAAMLLSVFEYWHNVKSAGAEQADIDAAIAEKAGVAPQQNGELWVYKTQAALKDDLLSLFGETKVLAATRALVAAGFVTTRSNPKYQWDRTTQYQFCPSKVQNAITQNYVTPLRNSKQSIAQKQAIKPLKSKAAIPEITTETTTEKKEKERAPSDSVYVEPPSFLPKEMPADPEERARYYDIAVEQVAEKMNGNGSKPYTDAELEAQKIAVLAKYGKKTT